MRASEVLLFYLVLALVVGIGAKLLSRTNGPVCDRCQAECSRCGRKFDVAAHLPTSKEPRDHE